MGNSVIRVWDLPTRLFHWTLVALVLALIATGSLGGNAMAWHFRCGYALASLLLFRLVWGLVGGHWSRFSSFWPSPKRLSSYLRGELPAQQSPGHNPLGGLSVLAMLLLLTLQVATGLFSDDEIAAAGPLSRFISNAKVSLLTTYHADVGKYILLALIALHVGAIVFYRVKRQQNLVAAMFSGDQAVAVAAPGSRDDAGSRLLALGVWCLCALGVAAGVYWVA